MAYVKAFEHDVFISYTRADDSEFGGRWVTVLTESIKAGLALKGLRDCSVFMDHELPGHLELEVELPRRLSDSACLVVILSPAYLGSEWCSMERRAFLDFVQRRKESGGPVFVVEKDDVPLDQWPPELTGRRGFRFWHRDLGASAARPIMKDADGTTYYDATMKLCTDQPKPLSSPWSPINW